ncbi:MAG: alpha-amylase family glycosyl hydrolase [Chloroherpetonaceae bacterium]|nr:alpha-amylase family glycosyl hydrolase [Chloroherpetonaceae bacterium]
MKKLYVGVFLLFIFCFFIDATNFSAIALGQNLPMKPSVKSINQLDTLYSSKAMGLTTLKDENVFRVFSPRAKKVFLILYEKHTDINGREIQMIRDNQGVWEHLEKGNLIGKYYGYRIIGPTGKNEMFDSTVVIADPYSKAVTTQNHYRQSSKSLIIDTNFDWEEDTWVIGQNHNDLIIYEAHLRDLTAHASSGVNQKGTYLGLTEKGKTGGLSYLKSLGVNAVEFLPIHKFGTIEIPYKDSSVIAAGYPVNTWNPYARNHWGYMTSYFFTPETYYATDGTINHGEYNGIDGRAVKEMKQMVKALHKEKIAVILDVVYNHVAQYDFNCFKYIDKFYYFRCDSSGNFMGSSGCGNDFKTERPMSRKMIVESVKYWMTEYHIDGFRFDLAAMIDWETCREIIQEAKKINPNVIIIAEPWGGGGYAPEKFSEIGWASWNDQIRNGVKGQNPHHGKGFIFGKFQGENTTKSIQNYSLGTLKKNGGLFIQKEHSINYLESHDDETMGDFIRVALGEVKEGVVIKNLNKHHRLSPKSLALNKLAALFLFTSQGAVMIHEGQEFGRSKVIAKTAIPDPKVGMIDRNSYEKDNETNYLNYTHAKLNRELVSYYQDLIQFRKKYNQNFGSANEENIDFIETKDSLVHAFKSDSDNHEFLVILNSNQKKSINFKLPEGNWQLFFDGKGLLTRPKKLHNRVSLTPISGVILKKAD